MKVILPLSVAVVQLSKCQIVGCLASFSIAEDAALQLLSLCFPPSALTRPDELLPYQPLCDKVRTTAASPAPVAPRSLCVLFTLNAGGAAVRTSDCIPANSHAAKHKCSVIATRRPQSLSHRQSAAVTAQGSP